MPPKPPFDISTARSPGRCWRTMVATISSSEAGAWADWPAARRSPSVAAPRAVPAPAASSGRPARSALHRPRQTPPRSRPGTHVGTTKPSAARTPPRCGPSGFDARRPFSVSATAVGMVREVVVHRHAACHTNDFEAALHARERPQPLADPHFVDADVGRDGNGSQRVAHVVRAEQRHLELTEGQTHGDAHGNAWRSSPAREIVRLPVEIRARCRTSARARPRDRPAPAPRGCRRRSAAGHAAAPAARAARTPS